MKRVIYLNFDLDSKDPYERLCYYFLESLGRQKKQVIKLLLRNSGMLNNHTIPPPEFRHIQHVKKHSNAKKFEVASKAVRPLYREDATPESEVSEAELVKQTLNPLLKSTSVVQDIQPDVNTPSQIFTEEQLKAMQEKRINYKSLSDSQCRILANALSEGIPMKAAFTQAQYSN